MDCDVCKWKDIKYRCIGWNIPICNVCAVACCDITPGYCEERYLVSKCEKCSNKRKYEGNVTPVSVACTSKTSIKAGYFVFVLCQESGRERLVVQESERRAKEPFVQETMKLASFNSCQ